MKKFEVAPDLVAALQANGPDGERAAGLLCDAGRILATAEQWHQPYEAAQSLCRGALEAILDHLTDASQLPPGLEKTKRDLIAAADTLGTAQRDKQPFTDAALDQLARTHQAWQDAVADRGGHRVRQVLQLVRQHTGRTPRAAEYEAARDTWSAYYSGASEVLHGKVATPQQAVDLFEGVVAAARDVFLPFADVLDELKQLALEPVPDRVQIRRACGTTNPLAIDYIFRTAVSEVWLAEMPLPRLLPEDSGWSAAPYLSRLADSHPAAVADWLTQHLDQLQSNPQALGTAVSIAGQTGIPAQRLMATVSADTDASSGVLDRVAMWVTRQVPAGDRNSGWVRVAQNVLAQRDFSQTSPWAVGEVLDAVADQERADDGLAKSVRFALADSLAAHLQHPGGDSTGVLDTVEDLRAGHGHSYEPFAAHLARQNLALARGDAADGHGLDQRLRALRTKVTTPRAFSRLTAVHLLESAEHRDDTWWQQTRDLLPGLLAETPRTDEIAFVAALFAPAVTDRPNDLETMVADALGTAPTTNEITEIIAGLRTHGHPLTPWYTAWVLRDAVPAGVTEPWQPLFEEINEFLAARAKEQQAKSVEVPTTERLLQIFEADGALAAARALAAVLTPTDLLSARTAVDSLISQLVATDPAAWAADPDAVCAVLPHPGLQTAYLVSLSRSLTNPPTTDTAAVSRCVAALVALARSSDGAEPAAELQTAACRTLRSAWRHDLTLDGENELVAWLDQMTDPWPPAPAPGIEDLRHENWPPRGHALAALIAWATRTPASDDLPSPAAQRLATLLADQDHHLAHAVIGANLAVLTAAAPAWADQHTGTLFRLDHPQLPARVWLDSGVSDPHLLRRLDTRAIARVLHHATEATETHQVSVCLLLDATAAGDLPAFLAAVADCPDDPPAGAAALSRLLEQTAFNLPRVTYIPGPHNPAQNAATVWRAALDPALPDAALAGAGDFAYSQLLPQQTWTDLMTDTIARTGRLNRPYKIVDRASRTAGLPVAAAFASGLLAQATPGSSDEFELQRSAMQLLRRIAALPSPTSGATILQQQLVRCGVGEAGDVTLP